MGPRFKVSSDRLVKPGLEPATPGLQGKRFIHYTTAAPPKPVITFYNCKIPQTLYYKNKTYFDLTVGPSLLIGHELYVENAVWIFHTLSTRECSSNERLRQRGEGVL